jgi:hypothetical protein
MWTWIHILRNTDSNAPTFIPATLVSTATKIITTSSYLKAHEEQVQQQEAQQQEAQQLPVD